MAIHIHLPARKVARVKDSSVQVGEKVTVHISGQKVEGEVEEIRGNMVSVAYVLNGYNKRDTFHISKIFSKSGKAFQQGAKDASSSEYRTKAEAASKDASFGIDDIAIGGTVIYKDGGSFKKAKAVSKSGMRVKLDNGREVHVGDIVSTDASDWSRYSSKDASEYRANAEAASAKANDSTKAATKSGTAKNHLMASQRQADAGLAWTNVANRTSDSEEKAAAKKKSEEHRRQSDFHYKNSIA